MKAQQKQVKSTKHENTSKYIKKKCSFSDPWKRSNQFRLGRTQAPSPQYKSYAPARVPRRPPSVCVCACVAVCTCVYLCVPVLLYNCVRCICKLLLAHIAASIQFRNGREQKKLGTFQTAPGKSMCLTKKP